jgi:hypothetical protein
MTPKKCEDHTEEWRILRERVFQERYEVSTCGRLRATRTGDLLTVHYQQHLLKVSLIGPNLRTTRSVARLIAQTFLVNRELFLTEEVRHKDEDPNNCHANNLFIQARAFRPGGRPAIASKQPNPEVSRSIWDDLIPHIEGRLRSAKRT